MHEEKEWRYRDANRALRERKKTNQQRVTDKGQESEKMTTTKCHKDKQPHFEYVCVCVICVCMRACLRQEKYCFRFYNCYLNKYSFA